MRKLLTVIIIFIILSGCGKSGGNEASVDPGRATLLKPAQNELCNQGNVISATQSKVAFEWGASANTTAYEISIKNLEDGSVSTNTVTDTRFEAILKRNAPYSWSVISKSTATAATAKSDIFKFYNSGPAVVNYAPFPAELNYPQFDASIKATSGKVKLIWVGNDVDGDIANYDVYCSTLPTPALVQRNVTAASLDVDVTTNSTYYWKIITRDSKGNTSDSGVFSFKVKA